VGGHYAYRRRGERHLVTPESIVLLQQATRSGDYRLYKEYARRVNDRNGDYITLRHLLEFDKRDPIDLEEVESVESILTRFATGAMSYGSISEEAHTTLAIAMNAIGAKSNTGEGGEDSRRFGTSLGIDLSPGLKQCNFDCIYCELEPARPVDHYTEAPSVAEILAAVRNALREHPDIDVLTVTANGEPTLYPHLDELITALEPLTVSLRTLILSNASTIHRPEIRRTLARFDMVKLSLDCATPRCFRRIDRPHPSVDLEAIKEGMLAFRREYSGALIVEVLVVRGINDRPEEIRLLNDYLLHLRPDRIDLGTIDRPPAYEVHPVDYETLRKLSLLFDPSLRVRITSRRNLEGITPGTYSEKEILATLAKRPLTPEDTELLFDRESLRRLENLIETGTVGEESDHGVKFYIPARKTLDN
jgi:wyosine [tRNA(Phe)-imidazoG37] synthetase (radical SAM superfamily)